MTSSLHVSVPDEMRAFVNQRTSGEAVYSTPSEYVRALIRDDMEKGFLAHCRENFDALTEIRKMPCFSHEN